MKNANTVSAAAALLVLLGASACGTRGPSDSADAKKGFSDHFPISVGGHVVSLQVALTDGEQHRGLMQRPDLGKDEGMIFVQAAPQRQNYWMKDCPEALDIAFAGKDGVIAEIYPLYPNDLRTVSSISDRLQYAVELPQGWFAANGVRPGAPIDLDQVEAAIKARGFDPARFGFRDAQP
ncbi:MAG TPA: DUF192 domain-containing protein [Opitutaceae bacterium]